MKKQKIGLITSGGDSPGMNKLIFDLFYLFFDSNYELILIKDGFKGLYDISTLNSSIDILYNTSFQTSSIIGTSRFPEFKNVDVQKKIKENLEKLNLDKLIIIGGDGSYEASKLLIDKINVIFIPATIDNDFPDNHLTLGYYSCLEFISKMIFYISLSAKSHKNIHMIEIMGNGSNELVKNTSFILNDLIYIDSKDITSLINKILERYKKEQYIVILLKEKVFSDAEKIKLINDLSNLLNDKLRITTLGYTQRSCEISLNDLIYSSHVSKYLFNNINSLNNVVLSYSFNGENNIKISKILNNKIVE